MEDTVKPIAGLLDRYKKLVPTPFLNSLLIFGASLPVAYGVRNISNNQAKKLADDRRIAALNGLTPQQSRRAIQQQQNTFMAKHGLPWLMAAVPAVTAAVMNVNTDAPYWGLHTWDPMKKYQSLNKKASMWETDGYQPKLDFSQTVNHRQVQQMFSTNPYISADPYAKNLGTSIIAAAPSYGNTTTLGNIYDSALTKFDKKLDFQGLAGKAIKGTIAGSLAGMFTDTVGTIFGFPDPLCNNLANSVGVGTALVSILN